MLLMHQFGDDARDSVACFAEGALGGSGGVCHAGGEFVQAALNAARVTQQRGCPLGGVGSVHSVVVGGHTASLTLGVTPRPPPDPPTAPARSTDRALRCYAQRASERARRRLVPRLDATSCWDHPGGSYPRPWRAL